MRAQGNAAAARAAAHLSGSTVQCGPAGDEQCCSYADRMPIGSLLDPERLNHSPPLRPPGILEEDSGGCTAICTPEQPGLWL